MAQKEVMIMRKWRQMIIKAAGWRLRISLPFYRMRVLLYSMVVYLLGVAILLWVRPALMFKKNGEWKEFGTTTTDTTVFPFWLFCTIWAVVVYLLISYLVTDDYMDLIKTAASASSVVAAAKTAAPTPPLPTANLTQEEETANNTVNNTVNNSNMTKAGYYKLDNSLMKKKGVPRYIYVGPDKPDDLEEA